MVCLIKEQFYICRVGYLVLKLYIDGCWKEIVIDDIFPFLEDGNESIFSTSFNKDIGWIALQKGNIFCVSFS